MKNNVRRRRNDYRRFGTFLGNMVCVSVHFLALWTLVSWVEVLCNNNAPFSEYNPWNIFVLFTTIFA